ETTDAEAPGEQEETEEEQAEGEQEASPQAAEPEEPSVWALLRGWYLTFDRRTLGFARIMLGWFFLTDLCRRGMAWSDMYSNEGLAPTPISLQRPSMYISFTILNAFSSPAEMRALFAVMFVTFFCLIIGYKTKLVQILSLVFVTGMNIRIGQIENGGYVAHN